MKKAETELINGVFLENKSKRKWKDKSGNSCFMLYSRALRIIYGNDHWYTWKCFKELSDVNIEVVKLITICWIEFDGKLEVSELSPEIDYEVAFVLKLKPESFGWELPNSLSLKFPNGQVHTRLVCLQEEPRGEWLEVSVGKFRRQKGETGELTFLFFNSFGHWKGGMIIKGAIIKPVK